MRLVADPIVVAEATAPGQTNANYGAVAITSILCYDEPPLDSRSWTGWNMWTVGWGLGKEPEWHKYTLDGHTLTNCFAYLYDDPDGFSCSLNSSSILADNNTGVTGDLESDLDEPDKTKGDINEYALSYPYVQGPSMQNGIGYVQFRARRDNTLQNTPSVVTLFGLKNPSNVEDVEELTNIVVNSDRYSLYTWRSTEDQSGYQAIRLAVKGAKGTGGRENPNPPYYTPVGYDPSSPEPIQKLQRVWIDDVAFSEPIAPRMALLNARPFRTNLTETVIVPDILSEVQQPLTSESFGFQVQLQPQQLADDVNNDSIVVDLAYYVGDAKWGWRNWINDSATKWATLKRVGDSMVWRSTFDNPSSIVSGLSEPGTVVQYFMRARFKDNSGGVHTNEIKKIDWAGGPSWYWPIDLNEQYGGGDDANFSPYTLLDSISPRCAWINEVNYYDGPDGSGKTNQFIELAVPYDADMTGWYMHVQDVYKHRCVLFKLGYDGVAPRTTANRVNFYSFLTVASPLTYEAGTLGTAPSGTWRQNSDLARWASISKGEMDGFSPYALELVRPSGIIEHQIVIEGTNSYIGGSYEYLGSGSNLCAELKREDVKYGTNLWFFAGADKGEGTLAVFRSRGEDASCWTNGAVATPAMINSTVGQDGSEWFLPLSGSEFAWIYTTILGKYMYVKDSSDQYTDSAVFMVAKGATTNITFKVDPWYKIASFTTNKVSAIQSVANVGSGYYVFPMSQVSNTVEIVASAGVSDNVTSSIDPRDPYFDAVIDWLKKAYAKNPEWGDEISAANFIGLSGTVTNKMSVKQMYWLDIPPTEGGWFFRAGMGGPEDAVHARPQPVTPVEYMPLDGDTYVTNVRVQVFMQLTNVNRTVDACYPPKLLRGLEPGSSSDNYSGSWTSVTFKVTGALQNGYANNNWVPLRWFVFGPDSFGAPGTPDAYTATIEVSDPFTTYSPAYDEGWYDYIGSPVFYSWQIDESRRPRSVEMLKKDSTY